MLTIDCFISTFFCTFLFRRADQDMKEYEIFLIILKYCACFILILIYLMILSDSVEGFLRGVR
mgnify:CR=1 FL=1